MSKYTSSDKLMRDKTDRLEIVDFNVLTTRRKSRKRTTVKKKINIF